MSFIIGKYYGGDPRVKPDQWGPAADVQAAIRENAARMGLPVPTIYFPCWERVGILPFDYISGLAVTNEQGTPTVENTGLKLDNNGNGTTNDVISIDNFLPTTPVDQTYIFRMNRYLNPNDGGICSNLYRYNFYYDTANNNFEISVGKDDNWRHEGTFGAWELNKTYNLGWTASVSKNEVHGIQDSTITSIPKYSTTGWTGRELGTISSKMYLGRRDGWTTYFGADAIYESILGFSAVLPDSKIAHLSDNPYGLLQPIIRRNYFISDGVSGNTYQVTCADGFSFSDSSLRNAIFSAACDEAINLSDNDSNIAQFLAALSDSFGLSDMTNNTAVYNVSVNDSLNINDNVTSLQKIIALVDDTVSIADVSIVRADIQGIATDSMALSDSLTTTLHAQAVVNEIINLSDTISTTTLGVIAALVSETFTVSDSTTSTAALIATISEALSLSDNAISVLIARANIAESFTLNDSSTWASITSALVADGFTLSDDINCRADLISALIENINISDATQSVLSAYAQVSDSLSIADTTFWAGIKHALAEDAFTVSGSVTGLIKIIANAADSITFDDSNNVTATFSVMCDDTVQFAHAIAAIAQFRASVSDGFNINATAMEVSTLPSGKVSVSFSFKKTTVVFNFK